MPLTHARHAVHALNVQLMFVCKRRGKVVERRHLDRLRALGAQGCGDFEIELLEFNGEQDHVHLLVSHPPNVSVAALVNSLKGVSSRRLKPEFPELQRFWSIRKSAGALGRPGDFAASVGEAPISVLRQYIEQRQSPDEAGRGLRAPTRPTLSVLAVNGRVFRVILIILCPYSISARGRGRAMP